jgi:hypothetical protein
MLRSRFYLYRIGERESSTQSQAAICTRLRYYRDKLSSLLTVTISRLKLEKRRDFAGFFAISRTL